jgi:hypothetical protein
MADFTQHKFKTQFESKIEGNLSKIGEEATFLSFAWG